MYIMLATAAIFFKEIPILIFLFCTNNYTSHTQYIITRYNVLRVKSIQ